MKIKFKLKKFLALAMALAITLTLLPLGNGASATTSSGATVSDFNYFSTVYTQLEDTTNVYKVSTYEDIINIFKSTGTYVVLIGGAWSNYTQAEIGYINQVAKNYGISAIYNFDTRLDGSTAATDIADSSNKYANYYVDLVNTYLTNLSSQTGFDKTKTVSYTDTNSVSHSAPQIQAPFLFVYNKDHLDSSGKSAPIISSLEGPAYTFANFSSDSAKVTAFKSEVAAVFDVISKNGVASYNTIDNSAYIKSAFNTNSKSTIFDSSDGNLVFEHVTYNELTKILSSSGNYAILFGGSWCPNTQAAIKWINKYAQKNNVSKIYLWDNKFNDGIGFSSTNNLDTNNDLNIRTTGHPYANLYVDLVNTYLTNITTLYDKNDGKASHNVSYTNESGTTITANKLQVPYFFLYNKDNKDTSGNKAPIIGHVELMYSWKTIQPDYTDSTGAVGANYKTYTTALDNLFSLLQSNTDAPAASGASSVETAIPTSSTVLVDGKSVSFDAYNIAGSNYFKLRDLAAAVNGTKKQFAVGWDSAKNSITITSASAYTAVGGELDVSGDKASKSATLTSSSVYLNSTKASLTAYNIGGNNYFKLRDIAKSLDFGVGWDSGTSTITISTASGYSA